MNLDLVRERADGYRSGSQRARVLTEGWAADELYCPACPARRLTTAPANTHAYDFSCPDCEERFQLKSTRTPIRRRVLDSEYFTMLRAVTSNRASVFFILRYATRELVVRDVLLIPHFFLHAGAIEKRNPLAPTARRAGWIGCNILFDTMLA